MHYSWLVPDQVRPGQPACTDPHVLSPCAQETGRFPAYKEMVAEYCWLSRCKGSPARVPAGTPGWGVEGLGPPCKGYPALVRREKVHVPWGPMASEGA